jgi:YVTN family beta-propeller protein
MPSRLPILLSACVLVLLPATAGAGRPRPPGETLEAIGQQLFASPQSNPIALSPDGLFLLVANTTSHSVSVINTHTRKVVKTIAVGMDPVSVAWKPDGSEAWVANHVSDSINVIDTAVGSASRFQVVETVQSLGPDGRTLFDEPVGVAFTGEGTKAYVALSSRNRIAVVDTASYQVTGTLNVRAQEPRALAVRNGRLYVAAFESGNKSEASACANQIFGTNGVGDQCSLGLNELLTFVTEPNVPGFAKNIVIDGQLPDRDLFVFDTATGAEAFVASGVGTLLYGVAVDSTGRAFVTQTDARNQVNGDEGENLVDLDNRMFLNQVSRVTCSGSSCTVTRFDLEPPPPAQPPSDLALANPYAIAISADDQVVVATAAGTSRVFTLNAATGAVRDVLDLGAGASAGQQIPRGLALRSDPGTGAPLQAWVLNSLENTVSLVDVSNPDALAVPEGFVKIAVGADPTPDAVRRGRIAFSNAFASDSGTFSCESCHPDANTDQLLWRIGGACFFGDCPGTDEPRTTMPVRGLKRTLPLHWDGTLGDPFGGGNGAVGLNGAGGTDCALGDTDGDHDCFVDLVEGSLAGVMCDQTDTCPAGGNQLSTQEIDDMAFFLASVSYPPARSRRPDDSVSRFGQGVEIGQGVDAIEVSALQGFSDFFMNQGGVVGSDPDTCADSTAGCHELPLGAADNSSTLNGFDAPTMRGMTDRFIQFSLGLTGTRETLAQANGGLNIPSPPAPFPIDVEGLETPIRWDPNQGLSEVTTFGAAFLVFEPVYGMRPLDLFQMFDEASTGFSGATGRQLTLNTVSAASPATAAMLSQLEAADARGVVNLLAQGLRAGAPLALSYRGDSGGAFYKNGAVQLTQAELLAEAQAGTLLMTVTAHLRASAADLQPLIGTANTGAGSTGDPPLPTMSTGGSANPPAFNVRGFDVRTTARVFLDGQPVSGATIACGAGSSGGICNEGNVAIDLPSRPPAGTHLLQLQNPSGRLSNELPFCVGAASGCLTDPGV